VGKKTTDTWCWENGREKGGEQGRSEKAGAKVSSEGRIDERANLKGVLDALFR